MAKKKTSKEIKRTFDSYIQAAFKTRKPKKKSGKDSSKIRYEKFG